MAIYRVQMSFPSDSALPADIITVNPHFTSSAPDALLSTLSNSLQAWNATASATHTLKAYDALKAAPSYPVATASHTGATPNSVGPREVAICLSYFAGHNRPRTRGRLYLPYHWFSATAPPVRPGDTTLDAVLDFADKVLTHQLLTGDRWVVYSRVDRTANPVTDVWCDNEWDTMRSRGLKADHRTTAKV